MDNYEFEKSFGDFLEQNEYEQAESAIFTLVRAAYTAGWNAACKSKKLMIIQANNMSANTSDFCDY